MQRGQQGHLEAVSGQTGPGRALVYSPGPHVASGGSSRRPGAGLGVGSYFPREEGLRGKRDFPSLDASLGKWTPDCPWAEVRRVQGGGPGESSWMSGHHMAMGGPPDCHSQNVALLSFLLFWDKMTQDMRFPGTLVPRKSLSRGASGNVALEMEECLGEAVPLCSVWSQKPGTEGGVNGDHSGRGGQPETETQAFLQGSPWGAGP